MGNMKCARVDKRESRIFPKQYTFVYNGTMLALYRKHTHKHLIVNRVPQAYHDDELSTETFGICIDFEF